MSDKKTKVNMPVSLCMIVKDEEKRIKGAIESVKKKMGIADLVVADTGSTDKTAEIAQKCGAKVIYFEWCDDFAAARNFAASNAEHDIIFFLDADEKILEANMKETIKLLSDECSVGDALMSELSEDGLRHGALRFYNRKTHIIKGPIHEGITPKEGIISKNVTVPVLIEHCGYLPEVWEEKGRFERNKRMLEKALLDNPGDPYYLYHLGKCYFNFSKDLDKACEYFEKALRKCNSGNVKLEHIYRTVECYGYALINTGKYREALNLLEVYMPHYINNPNFRFLAAHIFQNNGLFLEAVECYESCIGAKMSVTDVKGITSYLSYYNIGVILECLNMTEDAVEMYRNCIEYEPAVKRLKELGKHC